MARKKEKTTTQKIVSGVIIVGAVYGGIRLYKYFMKPRGYYQSGATPYSGKGTSMGYMLSLLNPNPNQQSGASSTGATAGNLPRGLRNNNPLNIIITGDQWQGKVPVSQNTDGKFEQFQNMLYGYRAAIKTLKAYFNSGRDTITEITQRWAPAGSGEGNNPVNYAKRVSQGTGIHPDVVLDFDPSTIVPIVREMAVVENGETFRPYISDQDIMKAWQMI